MTDDLPPSSSSLVGGRLPAKPPLAQKPVPKPRRRPTIGGNDGGKMCREENDEERMPPQKSGAFPLVRKVAYRNGTASFAPQLARKVLKCETNGGKEEEIRIVMKSETKEEKAEKEAVEDGGGRKVRIMSRMWSNGWATDKEQQNQSNGGGGRLRRHPAPLMGRRGDGNAAEKEAGGGGGGKWRKEEEASPSSTLASSNNSKQLSPLPYYLTPICPTASPETTTGSSLNSPTSPTLPSPTAHSWPNGGDEGQGEDRLLEELAKEGGAESRLIATWLTEGGERMDAGKRRESGGGGGEEHRPRFSLDHLVPPELQEGHRSPSEQSITADFHLRRRPSPRGQCQGTVFVHWHQERGQLAFSMDSREEKGRRFDEAEGPARPSAAPLTRRSSSGHGPSSASPRRQGVTLLEQLVKSHPIWFLPHLDRQAVAHFLRNQPPGVFIVRGSSRALLLHPRNTSPEMKSAKLRRSGPGPLMALSIRLPPSSDSAPAEEDQLDHFLLEAIGPGPSVRLEGSPNAFASLPLLLEHYARPEEAMKELKCHLRLPDAVARAESIQALQGLALMGQDFWTSSLCSPASSGGGSAAGGSSPGSSTLFSAASVGRSQCHSPACSSLRSGPLPSLPPPPPFPPPQMLSTFHHRHPAAPSPSTHPEYHFAAMYAAHHGPPMVATAGCCCCAGCPAHQQPPQHAPAAFYQPPQFPPLRKSQSVQSSLPPADNHRHQQQHQASGRLRPWCPSPGSQSLRERGGEGGSRQKEGGSFLRALFSPSPSRRKMPSTCSTEWTGGGRGAECPLWEEPTSENGAIWNGRRRDGSGTGKATPAQSNGGSIFARLKGNFRRTSSSGLGTAKDDWQGGANNSNVSTAELLWVRQAAFRRTNTDMGGCGMAAALVRMRSVGTAQQQQLPPRPNGAFPPPQLARVLPQPRREPSSTKTTMKNGCTTSSPVLGQIAVPPADIRKSRNQKAGWAATSAIGQHNRSGGLRRIQQQPVVQMPAECLAQNSVQQAAAVRLSGGSGVRSHAMVATVRPQPKMFQFGDGQEDCKNVENGGAHHHPVPHSEYTHLSELPADPGQWNGDPFNSSKNGDELSVAGTDFNEPWDSNAWENLLELARFGDAKAEVPALLGEQPKRRSCCSSSSNGSTWRRSSQSSSTAEEGGELEEKEVNLGSRCGDEIGAAEEAMAMAMILAGNGTLPSRNGKWPRKMGEEEEENGQQQRGSTTAEATSLDTLILIEQAAKAASSSRGTQNTRGRWTRDGTSRSLMDISTKSIDQGNGRVPDRPQVVEEENGEEMAGSSGEFDPFTGSMDELNNFKNTSAVSYRPSFDDGGIGHRRSEKRIRAMMEKSIDERQQQISPVKKTENYADRKLEACCSSSQANNNNIGDNFAQFNSTPLGHYHHHQHALNNNHHHHHSNHPNNQHQQLLPHACSSSMDELSHHSRNGSICPSITPVLSPSRLRNVSQEHPGEEDPSHVIQRYVENLSIDDQTMFGATLQRFIECTLLSREQDPYVVVRRVRQFLNGMKNYLVKNGEGDLHAVIERESDRLHADEFLNIDAILETVLDKILLIRIKAQLYRLMVLENTRNGELGKLSENLAIIRAMSPTELGFPEGTTMPDTARMEQISKQLRKMQNHYSPLKKLQLLLRALALAVPHLPLLSSSELRHQQAQQSNSSVLATTNSNQSYGGVGPRLRTTSGSSNATATAAALKHPPADELIRWLVYVLARSSTINCEIEAWYMWELLPQQVLSTGDAAYFLSILFSAVHVLKHPDSMRRLQNVSLPANRPLPNIADFLGSQSTLHDHEEASSDLLLRVAIPNEQEGSIEYHTFPVLPKMNVAKLCRVIAHQFSVSNPEDYGLYVLFEGLETILSPGEFPHLIRDQMVHSGKPHLFAYKRSEARIAWPRQAVSNFTSANASSVGAAGGAGSHQHPRPQEIGKERSK